MIQSVVGVLVLLALAALSWLAGRLIEPEQDAITQTLGGLIALMFGIAALVLVGAIIFFAGAFVLSLLGVQP